MAGGQVITLGGPVQAQDTQVRSRCLAKMKNWVGLTLASIKAEFPSWEIMKSFSVFSLKDRDIVDMRNQAESVTRLARAVCVDEKELIAQLKDALPFACATYRGQSGSKSSAYAWGETLAKMCDRRLRHCHPVSCLAPVLYRYIAMIGCPTSNTERGLGTLARVVGKDRSILDVRSQVGELKLVKDMWGMQRDELIEKAQVMYQQTFPETRAWSDKLRFSGGTRKKSLRQDCACRLSLPAPLSCQASL